MSFANPITKLSQLIADEIDGALIIGGTIIGALIETAATGARWVLSTPVNQNTLQAFTGAAGEVAPGLLSIFSTGGGTVTGVLQAIAPRLSAAVSNVPFLQLSQNDIGRGSFTLQVKGVSIVGSDDGVGGAGGVRSIGIGVTPNSGVPDITYDNVAGWVFGGGTGIRDLTFGRSSIHLAAAVAGTRDVPHLLPGTPVMFGIFNNQATAWNFDAFGADATNINCEVRRIDGGGAVTADLAFSWIAIF